MTQKEFEELKGMGKEEVITTLNELVQECKQIGISYTLRNKAETLGKIAIVMSYDCGWSRNIINLENHRACEIHINHIKEFIHWARGIKAEKDKNER